MYADRRFKIAALAVALTTGLAWGWAPKIALVGLVAVVLAVLILWHPRMSIYLTMIVGMTALPEVVPVMLSAGSVQFYPFEPFLWVATVYAFLRTPARGYLNRRYVAYGLMLALGLALAFFNSFSKSHILLDLRGPVVMIMGLAVGTHIAITPDLRRHCLRLLTAILWWSAGITILAAAGVVQPAGRVESAWLAGASASAGGSVAALRVLTPATHVALAAFCGAVALVIAQRATMRQVVITAAPALVIVLLSFSRNSVLAVAVASLFALVATRTAATVLTSLRTIALLGALLTVLVGLGSVVPDAPGADLVQVQASAYLDRVISGLSSESLGRDTSAEYRVLEDQYLVKAIGESPVVGHGLGFAYKPASGATQSFTATDGPFYGHDFYLWLLVKTGIVGLALFLYVAFPPVLSVLRRRAGALPLAVGAAAGALLAVSVVAPMPNGARESSLILGVLLGILVAVRQDALEAEQPAVSPVQLEKSTMAATR